MRDKNVFPVPLPNLSGATRRIRDMTLDEIEQEKVELIRHDRRQCAAWAFRTTAAAATGQMDQIRWETLNDLARRHKELERELQRLDSEPHLRRAISFGCIFFVLLGCPVAILFQRGDYLSAFISCFLPIIGLYYPLVMFAFQLSKEGNAPPAILWLANAVLALLSIIVFQPVLKR
jgi:lipopolysaccharide export system permease protein